MNGGKSNTFILTLFFLKIEIKKVNDYLQSVLLNRNIPFKSGFAISKSRELLFDRDLELLKSIKLNSSPIPNFGHQQLFAFYFLLTATFNFLEYPPSGFNNSIAVFKSLSVRREY
jgi:hypothetical protein